jgi:hypothetical protein
MFRRTLSELFSNTQAWDFDVDACKVALYNNTTAPDADVTTDALQAYNGAASQWVVANEVTGTNWSAGGVALAGQTVSVANSLRVVFDATDTASPANTTVAGTFGCLLYDTATLGTANRGISFHYFGGTQSVTNGVFTIVWHANGIINCTL